MNEETPPERRITTHPAAVIASVSDRTIVRWADAGLLPCVRTPGGRRLFRPADVQALLTAGAS
jgi:excisionase family DNA binding protein